MAHLTLNNLSKHYDDHLAVDDLSLNIKSGTFIALLGPSGCGKSTTLRMLAGFESPTSGNIYHGDQCLFDSKQQVPPELRHFGMVFQSYALWPHMNVEENVSYPLRVQGIKANQRRQRVKEALEIVQLSPYATRRPADLSGGQRQRVALARSLVTEPPVILLDEPLANLDRHLRATMEETFRLFHKRTGATMVYVTHDQGEAMSLADQIVVLKEGKMLQCSSAQQLYNNPKNTWLANFIGRGAIVNIEGVKPSEIVDKQTLEINLAKPHLNLPTTAVLIRPDSITLNTVDGLSAVVINCVYRGERYDIDLMLANKQTLQAYYHQALPLGEKILLQCSHGWALEQSV